MEQEHPMRGQSEEPAIDPSTGQPEGLVEFGPDGDPVRDPRMTVLLEKESYERIIDGLKIAAEAAAHLERIDIRMAKGWDKRRTILDQVRKLCVHRSGIESVLTFKETAKVDGLPMDYRRARSRWNDGLRQASGGMRQLGTVFRQNAWYSHLANQLDELSEKTKQDVVSRLKERGLMLPAGY